MVIASLYPPVEVHDTSIPIFDWDFIRALQYSAKENPHDYYVFLPQFFSPPDLISPGLNVHVKSTMELGEFFQESQVDVWHDFGHTPASHLVSLRCMSGQNFPITVKVSRAFLSKAQLTTYHALFRNDALICSNASIHKLVEAAHNQYRQSKTPESMGARVYTIPYGIASEQVNDDKKRDARYLLHLPEAMTIILCGGAFSPNNSMDLFPLIRAFETISKRYEDVLLIVSGSDEYGYADKVSSFIEDSALQQRILLMPNIGESARRLLLTATDIFISSTDTVSRDNQFQVLEAMARGVPVIATEDEKHGYIKHGKTGFKIERECLPVSYSTLSSYFPFIPNYVQSLIASQGIVVNFQQMIEHLTLLIEDVSLRKTLGEAGRQYVYQYHRPEKIAKKHENLWHDLCEKVSHAQTKTPTVENQVNGGWLPLLLSSIPQTIDERTPLQVTAYGEKLLETQNLIIYEEMSEVLFPTVILEILNLSRVVTCLSDITHSLLQRSDAEETKDLVPNIAYHIMWCIKQGLITQK